MQATKWRKLESIPILDSDKRELKVISEESYQYDKESGRYVKVEDNREIIDKSSTS